MKFTLSWLKDHLDTQADLNEIVEALTAIGLEVEAVDNRARFTPFVIARVLSAQKHPDANKLQILQVDYGADAPLQVICGAPNARAGLVGVFAPAGSFIPGTGIHLVSSKIRGIDSHGMMCSERELELSDDHDGIIELPHDLKPGSSYAVWRGLDDPIIDVALTPNRPDCAGVRGIARDLAARGLGNLKEQPIPSIKGEGAPALKVMLDFGTKESLCSGFAWVMVKGISNRPSPAWLCQRLRAIGLRPINAAVDITNYITHDLGRPLHVFDANKLKGHLTVRHGVKEEKMQALDGKTYAIDENICVIADMTGIQSIAGIMGAQSSSCDGQTTDIVIESALWKPGNIAATGRRLGITSDARYRFERGVDADFALPGLQIATAMLMKICGGQASEICHVGFDISDKRQIDFPLNKIKKLTSLDIETDEVVRILTSLGFDIMQSGDDRLSVRVPSWRPDITGRADLVEEILRIYGLEKIVPQPLPRPAIIGEKILNARQAHTRAARRALAARGMVEAINYSFISAQAAKIFGAMSPCLKLANPIAADMSDMRPSLLPGLLIAARRNADRGFTDNALFEVGDIYQDDMPQGQLRAVAGIRCGTATMEGAGRFWNGNAHRVGLYDAKADLFAVLDALRLDSVKLPLETSAPDYYHPGRSATIRLGARNILAHFGEFHPDALDALDISGSLCGFELFLDTLPTTRKKTGKRPPLTLSSLQSVQRDFAFIVDDKMNAATLLRAAQGADKKLIQTVEIFDVYEGDTIDKGKKSIAIEVTIQPVDQTLTNEEIDALSAKIIANVIKSTGGTLRQ